MSTNSTPARTLRPVARHARVTPALRTLLAPLALLTLLAPLTLATSPGCSVGPDYRPPQTHVPERWSNAGRPAVPLEGSSTDAPAGDAADAPPGAAATSQPGDVGRWWTLFDDPVLTGLIARAVRGNHDVRVALARVREARARRAEAVAAFWPAAELGVSHQYEGRSRNKRPPKSSDSFARELRDHVVSEAADELTAAPSDSADVAREVVADAASDALTRRDSADAGWRTRNLFETSFDASWEIDVFGGLRRSAEAADADTDAACEDLHDVLLTLLFEVARNYFEALGCRQRSVIAARNVDAQEAALRLTRSRCAGGLASELDVFQAQAQLAATRARLATLETSQQHAARRLSLLVGEFPDALPIAWPSEPALPAAPAEIPLGLPSDLLRRRPDIRRCERQLAAATARIGVATADLFPRFSLTGSFGSASHDVRHVLDGRSLFWSVGPAVSWPILESARVVANVRAREAIQAQLLAQYDWTIRNAVGEVEDAFAALRNERARAAQLAEAVDAHRRAVRLATAQYNGGVTSYLVVLDSQRSLQLAEDDLAQSRTALALHALSVFKALGGGWERCMDIAGDDPDGRYAAGGTHDADAHTHD